MILVYYDCDAFRNPPPPPPSPLHSAAAAAHSRPDRQKNVKKPKLDVIDMVYFSFICLLKLIF
jgi:hypothetical protein